MQNSYIKAVLYSLNTIRVFVFTNIPRREKPNFLLREGENIELLRVIKSVSQGPLTIYDLALNHEIKFGLGYQISMADLGLTELDLSNAVNFPEFDKMFNYDGDDLGAIYSKEETKFALWAPLASSVILALEDDAHNKTYHLMQRTDKGVYRITIKGDLLNRPYMYCVTNSGISRITRDPYGKGVTLDSVYSAVVDVNAIKSRIRITPQNEIKNYVDSVIYETSVRDFTEDNSTNILHKGKYLGFVEPGRVTNAKNPAGLDYLKYLGITHVQLLPIIDFRGVSDIYTKDSYNWGYDPISIFAIEGSYSTKPEIPQKRLEEFAFMVDELHRHNIRVNLDVVFNHVYDYLESAFEKVLPNYFFRRKRDGQIAEASGCGNDFASERHMAKKVILDALNYFVDVFDVDGYRFDLMGLLDIDTIEKGYQNAKKIKKDVMFYGEGWNMGYELPSEEKANMDNAEKLPDVAFFNDIFRDSVRGSNGYGGSLMNAGYVNGNVGCANDVEYVMSGSSIDIERPARFLNANQTINYVECHDNHTLRDKLSFTNEEEEIDLILKRIKFANAINLLSIGVPLIHMGQEVGLTKHLQGNTYNVTEVNNMDWKVVDERFEMAKYLKDLIFFRKNNDIFAEFDPNEYTKRVSFYQTDNGLLYTKYVNKKGGMFGRTIVILMNPNAEPRSYVLTQDSTLVFSDVGNIINNEIIVSRGNIGPATIRIFNID